MKPEEVMLGGRAVKLRASSALESTTFQATVAFLAIHGFFAWAGAAIPTELTMAAIVAFAGKEAAGKLRRG